MAGHAAPRLEAFFASAGVPGRLVRQSGVKAGLPDKGRNRLHILPVESEAGHLGGGAPNMGIVEPYRNPVGPHFNPQLLQVRGYLFHAHQQVLGADVELVHPQIDVTDVEAKGIRLSVILARGLVIRGLVTLLNGALDVSQIIRALGFELLNLFLS